MQKKSRVVPSYAYLLPITEPGVDDRSGEGARWEGSMQKKCSVLSSYAYLLLITEPWGSNRGGGEGKLGPGGGNRGGGEGKLGPGAAIAAAGRGSWARGAAFAAARGEAGPKVDARGGALLRVRRKRMRWRTSCSILQLDCSLKGGKCFLTM